MDAKLKLILDSPTGLHSEQTVRVNLYQWERIQEVLNTPNLEPPDQIERIGAMIHKQINV